MQMSELYESRVTPDAELPAYINDNVLNCPMQFFPSHWHEHVEFHYIVKGEATIHLNQQAFRVGAGDFVIANSNELHSGECTCSPYLSHVIITNIGDLSQELAQKNVLFQSVIQNAPTVRDLMTKIAQEKQSENIGFKQLCRGLLLELLVYLYRNYVVRTLDEQNGAKRKRDLERLNVVLCYIENHFTEQISNAQLAKMVCLSEDRFGHLFRDGVGQSPLQYINDIRLKKALGLLQTSKYTVTEVAETVGFRDYNHFGRMFRKRYGCTPFEVKSGKVKPESVLR